MVNFIIMHKYIPSNLDIDKLLSDVPPTFNYSRDCFVYILGLVTEIPAHTKGLLEKSTFVPINASILKQHVHNYRLYLDYLLLNGVFETDNRYIKEEKSKGYRYAQPYQTPVRHVEITKFTLIKGLTSEGNWERSMSQKYHELKNWFDELQYDYAGAEHWLREKYKADLKLGLHNTTPKFNANLMNIMRLKEKDYYFRVDATAGRLHTNLTSLKSELRGWLAWQGKPLVANDLKCAQPLLLTALLSEEFYENTSTKDAFELSVLNPKVVKTIDTAAIKELIRSGAQDIKNYVQAVESDLYVFMQDALTKKGYSVPTRDNAKDIMYAVLYSSNKFFSQPDAFCKRYFNELFPAVYEIICHFKKQEPNALALLMQKAESTLILDRITKRISKQRPEIAIYTVHDAILSPAGTEDYIKQVITEETVRAIGLLPTIKQELLSPLKPSTGALPMEYLGVA